MSKLTITAAWGQPAFTPSGKAYRNRLLAATAATGIWLTAIACGLIFIWNWGGGSIPTNPLTSRSHLTPTLRQEMATDRNAVTFLHRRFGAHLPTVGQAYHALSEEGLFHAGKKWPLVRGGPDVDFQHLALGNRPGAGRLTLFAGERNTASVVGVSVLPGWRLSYFYRSAVPYLTHLGEVLALIAGIMLAFIGSFSPFVRAVKWQSRRAWSDLVISPFHGPAEPEVGFEILRAERLLVDGERDGVPVSGIVFASRLYCFYREDSLIAGYWKLCDNQAEPTTDRLWTGDADPEAYDRAWAAFAADVDASNRSSWRASASREELEAMVALERAPDSTINTDQRELERLAELLPTPEQIVDLHALVEGPA